MSFSQYLDRYAEPESNELSSLTTHYKHCLVLPAFNESDGLLKTLAQLPESKRLLVILVVNVPDNARNCPAHHATLQLASSIRKMFPVVQCVSEGLTLLRLDNARLQDCLLVERCDEGHFIPRRQGVGLARKIACDIAIRLIHDGRLGSPWIHSTDADVMLPEHYFSVPQQLDSTATALALYPFRHGPCADSKLQQCQRLYDFSLDYYVAGLQWAGSPYAFHTIGSTFLINARHYVQVRGFPRRNAAEDFYLFNKLAKTGEIQQLETPVLDIETRASDRVPFGTGPAVNDIGKLADPCGDYRYYHPEVFDYLKAFLEILPDIRKRNTEHSVLNPEELAVELAGRRLPAGSLDPDILQSCLQTLKVKEGLIQALTHGRELPSFLKHFHAWFDAFRTLKFIHFLRDNGLASQPLSCLGDKPLFRENPLLQDHIHYIMESTELSFAPEPGRR